MYLRATTLDTLKARKRMQNKNTTYALSLSHYKAQGTLCHVMSGRTRPIHRGWTASEPEPALPITPQAIIRQRSPFRHPSPHHAIPFNCTTARSSAPTSRPWMLRNQEKQTAGSFPPSPGPPGLAPQPRIDQRAGAAGGIFFSIARSGVESFLCVDFAR